MKDWEKTLSKVSEACFSTENMLRLISGISEYYNDSEKADNMSLMQHAKLADMWLELGNSIDFLDYSIASECYEHCVTADSRNARGWYGLANSLPAKERKRALFSIDNYLKLNPYDSDGWNFRGVLLSFLNRNEDAVIDYNKSINLNKKNISAYHNKILSLAELKRYEECLKTVSNILFLNDSGLLSLRDEDKAYFRLDKATALKELGYFEESLLYFDQYLEFKDYSDVEILIKKGKVLKKLCRDNEGEIFFLRAFEYALKKALKGSYAWISSDWADLAKCFSCFSHYAEAYQCLIIAEKVDSESGDVADYFKIIQKYLDLETLENTADFIESLSLKEATESIFRKAEEIISVKESYSA